MAVENYDVNGNLFNPSEIIIDLEYIYALIKKYKELIEVA